MPSSVMLGSRPRICWMRAYSSRVTPCSAAISGVTLISALAVAICAVRGPSVEFWFEIAIKSGRPLSGRYAVFLGVHNWLAHSQIVRDSQKRAKFSPNGKAASGTVHRPANIHYILVDDNIRAIVNVGAPQDFFLLRAVEIKPAGLVRILKHGEKTLRAWSIEHEIAVILRG